MVRRRKSRVDEAAEVALRWMITGRLKLPPFTLDMVDEIWWYMSHVTHNRPRHAFSSCLLWASLDGEGCMVRNTRASIAPTSPRQKYVSITTSRTTTRRSLLPYICHMFSRQYFHWTPSRFHFSTKCLSASSLHNHIFEWVYFILW